MSPRTVYIELSQTPIYRRIAQALGAQLAHNGLQVLAVKPEGFDSESFQRFVEQPEHADAVYISTASSNAVQSVRPATGRHYFESFAGRLVFLHQDTILGGLDLLGAIAKLQAWQRVAARAAHLCIEAGNIADLAAAGIAQARLVPHASEFAPVEPLTEGFVHDAAFVGHAVPSQASPRQASARLQQLLDTALQARRTDFASALEPQVKAFADQALDGLGSDADRAVLRVAQAQWLRNAVTGLTLPLRGWVFEEAGLDALDVYGGDPAYLHGIARQLQVARPGLHYHPAVYEPAAVQRVFGGSRVNINISSLQFDHAVVNRFHDVVLSGGLCLTDARDGLAALTPAHAEVSFRTLDELRDKVRHFSQPAHARERALLVKALQQDVLRHSGYPLVVRAILDALAAL